MTARATWCWRLTITPAGWSRIDEGPEEPSTFRRRRLSGCSHQRFGHSPGRSFAISRRESCCWPRSRSWRAILALGVLAAASCRSCARDRLQDRSRTEFLELHADGFHERSDQLLAEVEPDAGRGEQFRERSRASQGAGPFCSRRPRRPGRSGTLPDLQGAELGDPIFDIIKRV